MQLHQKRVFIAGATSAVAQEFARLAAARGCRLILAARNTRHLESIAADIRARGAEVHTIAADLAATDAGTALVDEAWNKWGGLDVALIAYGLYAERDDAETTATLVSLLETNFVSAAHLALRITQKFAAAHSGSLAAITSVAGDRGRRRNYVYGASKGALSVFLQGLDHKFAASGVTITDIKLGMVASPMTEHLPRSPLMCSPLAAASGIVSAIEKQRARAYIPGFWRPIMTIVRNLPRIVMNRLDL
jgi:decaprenylphospho-beta-D-erythro-pentofuranosid-2-ulose 2-reductase